MLGPCWLSITIILIDAERVGDKSQHLFLIVFVSKVLIEDNFVNLVKDILD